MNYDKIIEKIVHLKGTDGRYGISDDVLQGVLLELASGIKEEQEYNAKLKVPFTFTALTEGTLGINKSDYAPETLNLQYNHNNTGWLDIDFDNGIELTLAEGDTVSLRGDNNGLGGYDEDEDGSVNYINWSGTATFKIWGSIMSVLSKYGYSSLNVVSSYAFANLFYNYDEGEGFEGIVDAFELLLPATTLADSCYYGMFYNCTSLQSAPALPANTLSSGCYTSMFSDCSSLTSAPSLPATTLANACYNNMFQNCTSLVEAPALPATALYSECYRGMFQGCTSLQEAPSLPATALYSDCYRGMFQGCTSLTSIEIYATDISASNALNNWLNNVAATGTFKCVSGVNYPSGVSGVPSGWTVETL